MTKIINIRVLPRSSKNQVIGELADGTLKIKLMAAPVDGKANEELVKLLADYFQVSKNRVEIIRGLKSKNKVVQIG